MRRNFLFLILFSLVLSLAPRGLFAEETEVSSYDDIKFPQWVRDLRRTEIITFGSLPFVTLWTTVGYSLYEYGELRNPLDKSTDSFTETDQWRVIKISAVTCIALGLADLTINLISRARKESRLKKERAGQPFTVTPVREAVNEAPPLENESDSQAARRLRAEKESEDGERAFSFIEGVESAVF